MFLELVPEVRNLIRCVLQRGSLIGLIDGFPASVGRQAKDRERVERLSGGDVVPGDSIPFPGLFLLELPPPGVLFTLAFFLLIS